MSWTVDSLYCELLELGENQRIEAKRSFDIGPSIMQTICAYANEPDLGGGYLLLGVCEPDVKHENYWIEGVKNTDKLLNDLIV